MGVKSTLEISKSQAIEFIQNNLDKINDQALANLVEIINDYYWDKKDFENTMGLHNFEINADITQLVE